MVTEESLVCKLPINFLCQWQLSHVLCLSATTKVMLPCLCEILEGGVRVFTPSSGLELLLQSFRMLPAGNLGGVRRPSEVRGTGAARVAGQALAAALAGHRGLRDLALHANGFGDAGAEAGESDGARAGGVGGGGACESCPPWLWVWAPGGSVVFWRNLAIFVAT